MPISTVTRPLASTDLRMIHKNGYVHHDVSIGNVLIDAANHARLTDFEFAERFVDSDQKSRRMVRVGRLSTLREGQADISIWYSFDDAVCVPPSSSRHALDHPPGHAIHLALRSRRKALPFSPRCTSKFAPQATHRAEFGPIQGRSELISR